MAQLFIASVSAALLVGIALGYYWGREDFRNLVLMVLSQEMEALGYENKPDENTEIS